jgi:transposase
MQKHREIIRLAEGGEGQREISRIVHCSLRTVSDTLKAVRKMGIGYKDLADIDDAAVRQILFNPVTRVSDYYQPDFAGVAQELTRKGVNLALLWDEYSRVCAAAGLKGYQYSQYCNLYRQWRKENGPGPSVTMRIHHSAGRLHEVDWAGTKSEYTNLTTGEIIAASVFVGCLPYSQRIYAEAFDDMAQHSWTRAHVHNFRYNKGVTALITPDNCKTGVVKPDYFDPTVNRDYAALAEYYGCAILPTRPARPTDKPSTENSVKFVETWVIAYLRRERFFSLAELNVAIARRVKELNAQPLKGKDHSRDDVFWAEEYPNLIPLPNKDFEPSEWRTSKVQMDYCIQVMRQRYSVPHRLVGQHVDVRITASAIEVFSAGERICSHARLHGRFNQYSIHEEHMPQAHRLYAEEWNPERFKRWAASVGPATLKVIGSILESKPHPAQTYRACMGVMSYARVKGNSFLEDICHTAIAVTDSPSYKQIKMLVKGAATPKKAAAGQPDGGQLSIGEAGMVRGADYYKVKGR